MTNEEIEKEVIILTESLEKLTASDSLTKKEKRQKYILSLKKATLLSIKEARENNNKSQEFQGIAQYGVLTSYGDKHPLLLLLARSKFGIGL